MIPHVSVTQVGKYRDCPRRWWQEYIGAQKAKPTTAQTWGQEVHSAIEAWLERGEESDLVMPLIPHLPPAGEGWYACEVPISPHGSPNRPRRESEPPPLADLTPAGVPLIGYVDLVVAPDGGGGRSILAGGVYDFKTTSRASYLLGVKGVEASLQMLVYAHAYCLRYGAVGCAVGHLGIPPAKDGPPRWTTGFVTAKAAEAAYNGLVQTVEAMLLDAEKRNIVGVRAERGFCSRYGGCPFRSGLCSRV